MKSFRELLLERKDHYIKKMSNLSSEEKKILIDFFKKKSTLEGKIDWNKWKTLTFADFEEVMGSTTSSMKREKRKLRHKGISGLREKRDYMNIIIKNKKFLVYLPLNFKAAQVIASSHIGGVQADWCIANSEARKYFKSEIKRRDLVPLIVIGNNTKYAAIINTVMDKFTVYSASNECINGRNPIPNFNIKKELLTSGLKELYYDITSSIWPKGETSDFVDVTDYNDAVSSYEELEGDLDVYLQEKRDSLDAYNSYIEELYDDTIEKYREWASEAEQVELLKNKRSDNIGDRIKEIKKIMKVEPTGTGINDNGEVVWNLRGINYTMGELNDLFKFAKKEYITNYEEPDFTKRDELLDIVNYIEKLDSYEIIDDDNPDIEWSDHRYEMDGYNDYNIFPSFNSDEYEDYFDFAEDYFDIDKYDIYDLNQRAEEYCSYEYYDTTLTGKDILDYCDCSHPKEALKKFKNLKIR